MRNRIPYLAIVFFLAASRTLFAVPHDHDGDGVPDHAVHGEPLHDEHDHDEHDHDEHAEQEQMDDAHILQVTTEMTQKLGIKSKLARAGSIKKTVQLPAEVNLNRDATATVSARYDSVVRRIDVEIGDTVAAGDVLAKLENRDTLTTYDLKASISGVIISKDIGLGEVVGPERGMFQISDLTTVWADISVFPRFQHAIKKEMPVLFMAHDGHTTTGKIAYISPLVSRETRTFMARAILQGADSDFTPGAFVRATINLGEEAAAVVVEREAVQEINGESNVFVPCEGGFTSVVVQLGPADRHSVAILSGLDAGDSYVSEGAFSLKAEILTSGIDPHAGHGH